MDVRIKLLLLVLLAVISSASARCTRTQKLTQCNAVSKAAFASAFAAAVSVRAKRCTGMTYAEWRKVGCDSPLYHRFTKLCVPATWSSVLRLVGAGAMALKSKILFGRGYTRQNLFNTRQGRALVRHELTHIRQQTGRSPYSFGYSYITEYCKAGCSYYNNKYEREARRFQNDRCVKIGYRG